MQQDVCFANVDFVLKSTTDLESLIARLGNKVSVLCNERLENSIYFVVLEIRGASGFDRGADELIEAFYLLIKKLPAKYRRIMDECEEKAFDIGFESGNTEKNLTIPVKKETIVHLAEIGASIAITVYPMQSDETKVIRLGL